jgi:hypothetical protein
MSDDSTCDPRFAQHCENTGIRQIEFTRDAAGKAATGVFELPAGAPPSSIEKLDSYLQAVAREGTPEALLPPWFIKSISDGGGLELWKSKDGRASLQLEPIGGAPPAGAFARLTVRF